jgi:transcriptional regulator with XRE-family HTH domain
VNRLLETQDIGLKIKWWRGQKRLSMRELAGRAEVAASLVSKIEAGKTSPTVMSLQKILRAMDVDFYEFFAPSAAGDPSESVVFRKPEMVVSEDGERVWYYALPKHPDIKMQLTYEEYQPRTQLVETESHKGDIGGIVIEGQLTIEVVNRGTYVLNAGDAFYVKGGRLHAASNAGGKTLRLFTAELKF